MMRRRDPASAADPIDRSVTGLDVNAVVSYNLKAIRERQGWTQQGVAQRLAQFTGRELPQASISAMERGFDGDRRRLFNAHELYLLSQVFDVPIAYFFLPPPDELDVELADTRRPVAELYAAMLGRDDQMAEMDERLTEIGLADPANGAQTLAAIYGADWAAGDWFEHFRTWRKKRLLALERQYGDRLDDVAQFLATFADELGRVGPRAYLQMKAHREGESVLPANAEPEEG